MTNRSLNAANRSSNHMVVDAASGEDPLEAGSVSSLDLAALVQGVLRHLWIVVATATLLTGATIGFSVIRTPEYEASIKMIIGQGGKLTQDPIAEAGLQNITDTMVVAVDTRPVAEGVIQQLDLHKTPKAFLDDMSASRIGATQFIEVTYRDTDPKRAQLVANTIGEVFSHEISGVSPGRDAITATTWEPATIPTSPVDPDPIRNGAVALALGLILGVGLALLLDYLSVSRDYRKKTEKVAERLA